MIVLLSLSVNSLAKTNRDEIWRWGEGYMRVQGEWHMFLSGAVRCSFASRLNTLQGFSSTLTKKFRARNRAHKKKNQYCDFMISMLVLSNKHKIG